MIDPKIAGEFIRHALHEILRARGAQRPTRKFAERVISILCVDSTPCCHYSAADMLRCDVWWVQT
jgi:hypothetical protein